MGISSSISPINLKKTLKVKNYKNKEIITSYNYKLNNIKKVLYIKNGKKTDKLHVLDDNKGIIKDGRIFKIFKKDTKYIIKDLSIYVTSFKYKCQIKVKINNKCVSIISIPSGNNSKKTTLISLKLDKNFFSDFCGLEYLLIHENKFKSSEENYPIEIHKKFIKLYYTNFDKFIGHIKKTSKVEDFHLYYFKGEKNKVYINSKALKIFNEFIKERVLDNFKYINLENIEFSAFRLEKDNSAVFENIIILKLKYYEFFLGNFNVKKLYKIK